MAITSTAVIFKPIVST